MERNSITQQPVFRKPYITPYTEQTPLRIAAVLHSASYTGTTDWQGNEVEGGLSGNIDNSGEYDDVGAKQYYVWTAWDDDEE